MNATLDIESIFVSEDQIPQEFLIDQVHQKEFLSNGEMKSWNGDVHSVYSPVCVRTSEGLKRKLIGTYPICTQKEAMESLDAAVAAYNNGRGAWPTMGVQERIACVENFTHKMIAQKDIVVKLIMWEIGKSYADSIK